MTTRAIVKISGTNGNSNIPQTLSVIVDHVKSPFIQVCYHCRKHFKGNQTILAFYISGNYPPVRLIHACPDDQNILDNSVTNMIQELPKISTDTEIGSRIDFLLAKFIY